MALFLSKIWAEIDKIWEQERRSSAQQPGFLRLVCFRGVLGLFVFYRGIGANRLEELKLSGADGPKRQPASSGARVPALEGHKRGSAGAQTSTCVVFITREGKSGETPAVVTFPGRLIAC